MKKQTSIYLDTELYQIVKMRKLNISHLLEELLRQYLERKENRSIELVKKELNDLTNSYLLNKTVIEQEIKKLEAEHAEIKQKAEDEEKERRVRDRISLGEDKFAQIRIDMERKQAIARREEIRKLKEKENDKKQS